MSKVSKRHFVFNIVIIVIPWLSMFLLGKRDFKRFSIAGVAIILVELISHKIGQKLKWWIFFDKRKSYLTNELPFSIGPYMPLSLWILKYSYGNFKKFLFLNAVSDGIFAFFLIKILEKIRIIGLHRLNQIQFFFYLYHRAFILYGVQNWFEKHRKA